MYMLDTNICIYVLKNRSVKLRNKFKAVTPLIISSITYAELRFGIENGVQHLRDERLRQLSLLTRQLTIEPWGELEAERYGVVRSTLKITARQLVIKTY